MIRGASREKPRLQSRIPKIFSRGMRGMDGRRLRRLYPEEYTTSIIPTVEVIGIELCFSGGIGYSTWYKKPNEQPNEQQLAVDRLNPFTESQ